MHNIESLPGRRNSVSATLFDSSIWPINFSSSMPRVHGGENDEAFWRGLLALDPSQFWTEDLTSSEPSRTTAPDLKLTSPGTSTAVEGGKHSTNTCDRLTNPVEGLAAHRSLAKVHSSLFGEKLSLPPHNLIHHHHHHLSHQEPLSPLPPLTSLESVLHRGAADLTQTSTLENDATAAAAAISKTRRYSGGKRKRQRSAPISELTFDRMYDEEHEQYWRIRAWKNSRDMVFYDCLCGKRKAVQDLNKIKKHCERHANEDVSCSPRRAGH